MDKNFKNVLALVGAVAVVKVAPVLALGAAIGAAASNPDKVKEAMKDIGAKVENLAARAEAAREEELSRFYEDEDCEYCCGGKCDCEGECCCDIEEETEPVSEDVGAPTEEPTSWEDDVPVEEPAPEMEPEPAPAVDDKLELLRAKAEDFLAALNSLKE